MRHIVLACALLFTFGANAHEVMDNKHHVDTLSFAERISLHTNSLDWILGVPNLGVEVDIKARNYNRWSVKGNLRYRPATKSTFVRPLLFNLFEVSLEGRQYWRERQATPTGIFHFHRMWYDKLFSCRSMLPSHPTWAFYRGGYVAYTKYTMLAKGLFGGRQGDAIQAGFTWGFEKPLYLFSNGNSMDLDCGFSAGFAVARADRFLVDQENNAYRVTRKADGWKFNSIPVLKDLHVSFVYRFGNYPFQKRYRWRYDADMDYRLMKDSIFADAESRSLRKYIADSIYKVVYTDFRQIYDSVLSVRKAEEKAAQIERTKKYIDSLKAESVQTGEELPDDYEPGKSKKSKKKKKDDNESEATETENDNKENATEQEEALVTLPKKEDYNEA